VWQETGARSPGQWDKAAVGKEVGFQVERGAGFGLGDTMDSAGALDEAVVFLKFFHDLADPHQHGKVVYPLDETLPLSLMAVLAGAETFTDIARFGERKLDFLRRFLPFEDGTPPHDTLGDIYASLDAEKFCCVDCKPHRRRSRGDADRRQDGTALL
jgi:hypothetical protein